MLLKDDIRIRPDTGSLGKRLQRAASSSNILTDTRLSQPFYKLPPKRVQELEEQQPLLHSVAYEMKRRYSLQNVESHESDAKPGKGL